MSGKRILGFPGKNVGSEMVDNNMNFRQWLIESTTPTKIQANIPVPPEARVISKVLKAYDSRAEVYMVGGAVRDYLFALHHGGGVANYKPKDVDLTTNLSEEEILTALRTPLAQQNDIRVKEKESVDTFGVVFVTVGKSPTMEVAPFRKDIGGTGRRPDAVERGTMYDDAMRRDFTINNLYYDFDRGVIVDLNPNAQGIKDVQEGPIIRPVGNPFDRFNEDKLRVLRMMRFFSRFNPGRIGQFLDTQTLQAVEQFKDLQAHGITPERILDEFLKGIQSSQDTSMFLQNYADLDLFPAVFPGMTVYVQDIPRIGNSKNAKVIYAILLRGNPGVAKKLNALKYPVPINEGVQFLIDLMVFNPEQSPNPQVAVYNMLKMKERLGKMQPPAITNKDLQELVQVGHGLVNTSRIQHLLGYQPLQVSGEELMRQGYRGADIGKRQKELGHLHYGQSWGDFSKANPQATPTAFYPQKNLPGTQS